MPSAIDFAGLLRAALTPQALGGLGMRPAEFWVLTPIELRLMLGREGGGALMSRARLDDLIAAYPDGKGQSDGASARSARPNHRAGTGHGADGGGGGGL